VLNEVFDLFANLDATDEQLDFPIIYGSAKHGWMATSPKADARHGAAVRPGRPEARARAEASKPGPFRMLGTTIEANPFLGRILTGRIAPAR
jgi:GTP-binding protein